MSTDSRTLLAGDVFVAIQGDRFDGRKFVAEALERGALAAFSQAGPNLPAETLRVADPYEVLAHIARAVRSRTQARVIAIAGSAGKTTCKEMLAKLLAPLGPLVASKASFNNNIGVPATLACIESGTRRVVAEIGTNHPGELAPLARLVRPHAVVVTSIGAEHLEGFGDLCGVLDEEMEAVRALPPGGCAYVNFDSEPLRHVRFPSHVEVIRIGFREGADYRGQILDSPRGVGVRLPSGSTVESSLAFDWQRSNLLLAATVAHLEGVSNNELIQAASALTPAPLRGEQRTIGTSTVLVDCYNSNPLSAQASLADLATRSGRKAAVLGEMRELGDASSAAHEELGREARNCGISDVIWVGRFAEDFARGYGRPVKAFATTSEAQTSFSELLRSGGTVLIKASRGIALETLLECSTHA